MALYWISYDLHQPGQNYNIVVARLKELGASRVLLSGWFLPLFTATAKDFREDLERFLDQNDRILITELRQSTSWRNLLISDQEVRRLFTTYAAP